MYVVIIDLNKHFAIYTLVSFSYSFLKLVHSYRYKLAHSMQTESIDYHLKSHIVGNSYIHVICFVPFGKERLTV